MRKGKIRCLCRHYSSKRPTYDVIIEVDGYIDDTIHVGYYKDSDKWISTDLPSGLSICEAPTRKACAKKVEDIWHRVLEKRNDNKYSELLKRFENAESYEGDDEE